LEILYLDYGSMTIFEVCYVVLCDVTPRGMHKPVHIHAAVVAEIGLRVEVGDVVGFEIVVPGDDLDDVGYHIVDCLLPTMFPECVT
jgi:hypothetical protein